jgi:hypothetical protein
MKKSSFILHAVASYDRTAHNKMMAGVVNILSVLGAELQDPHWGEHCSDVFNPRGDESPRIVAKKIAQVLQSIISGDPVALKNLPF